LVLWFCSANALHLCAFISSFPSFPSSNSFQTCSITRVDCDLPRSYSSSAVLDACFTFPLDAKTLFGHSRHTVRLQFI
jgi:hypothetical protein